MVKGVARFFIILIFLDFPLSLRRKEGRWLRG